MDTRMYNVHTHIFNFKCVPTGFLTNYLPRAVVRFLGPLLRIGPVAWTFSKVMRLIPVEMVKKYQAFVAIGIRNTPQRVFEDMIEAYPEDSAFVVLSMNFDHMGGGDAPANYKTQLALVADVKRKYPNRCYPFLGVDPRMGDAGYLEKFVRDYFEPEFKGFHGIKLYPSLGFYPSDDRLARVYAYAEKKRIPVLTHCTRSGAFYAARKVPADLLRYRTFNPTPVTTQRHQQPFYTKDIFTAKPKGCCDAFLDPVHYYDVLNRFPDLKLCFAHFGGIDEVIKGLSAPGNTGNMAEGYKQETSWHFIIKDLMSAFRQVRADISYTLADTSPQFINAITQDIVSPIGDRILFGTDFFMTLQEKSEKNLYTEFREALLKHTPAGMTHWEKIIYHNNKEFLSSDFYIVP